MIADFDDQEAEMLIEAPQLTRKNVTVGNQLSNPTVAKGGGEWTVQDVEGFGSTRHYKDTVDLVGGESSMPPGRALATWHQPISTFGKIREGFCTGFLLGAAVCAIPMLHVAAFAGMQGFRDLAIPACAVSALAGVAGAYLSLNSPGPEGVQGSLWKDSELLGGHTVFQPADPNLPLVDLTDLVSSARG
jgi:hypothetical protein